MTTEVEDLFAVIAKKNQTKRLSCAGIEPEKLSGRVNLKIPHLYYHVTSRCVIGIFDGNLQDAQLYRFLNLPANPGPGPTVRPVH